MLRKFLGEIELGEVNGRLTNLFLQTLIISPSGSMGLLVLKLLKVY